MATTISIVIPPNVPVELTLQELHTLAYAAILTLEGEKYKKNQLISHERVMEQSLKLLTWTERAIEAGEDKT